MDIIQKQLWPMFGQQIIYFDHPVEVNIVPDYYKVCLRLSQKACWEACWVLAGKHLGTHAGLLVMGEHSAHYVRTYMYVLAS